ncbi:cytochrome-c peroxidase [Reichenbachiella versicolor]|uniref:cytochrome-c peroxidase n=1 Tax=Reichenbachiella versicolor TaxID=1821036 RepID=UPI000D6E5E7B|nr:cytochrome c peroxidase [Reichenbachiella versicolor]
MKRVFKVSPLLWACIFFYSCSEEEVKVNNDYKFISPVNFPEPTYTFENNQITEAGFELGRHLFYDPILSVDGTVSCNSCHQLSLAFADAQQHPLSIGVNDRLGIRNAPSLANLAYFTEFFWDGGVTHLDHVPINAIEAEFEMDEELSNVVQKLRQSSKYDSLFKQAFDVDEITSPFMLYALAQFTTMMVSANSKYDKYVRNEEESLTEQELRGLESFEAKCSSCHSGVLFTDMSYRNNGISSDFVDLGRATITELESDIGKFRVPSLRNVQRTSPYMHNAKFKTLEEVLDHYESGISISETLDSSLEKGIVFENGEKDDIIVFLKTLTDYEFISDERFTAPQ